MHECVCVGGGGSVLVVLAALSSLVWASSRENLSLGGCKNKGADQPTHPRNLISAFIIGLLESIISRLAAGEISYF